MPEGLKDLNRHVIFHVLTIFPEFFEGPFAHGVVKRAQGCRPARHPHPQSARLDLDRHKTVDDRPFGGAEGMVLKAGADLRCGGIHLAGAAAGQKVAAPFGAGRLFDQAMANRLSRESRNCC